VVIGSSDWVVEPGDLDVEPASRHRRASSQRGSSVFPTRGYANPTVNLVALAFRLGDRLAAAM